ncbi:Uncharacterized protein TCAP_05424 [Tolypocladium capitatum]|uniref:Uncharacterized protein n=1 Tax=Tolypocladium capitatum TaxID=45235 RepID=A0A2K3QAQ7_9HYPO|nr:Uncharacterized protein TCAP_05424 [Tolypocladium capitatum]
MVGSATYSDEEITWVLERVLAKDKPADIQVGFGSRFGRELIGSQVRYLKNNWPQYSSASTRDPQSVQAEDSNNITAWPRNIWAQHTGMGRSGRYNSASSNCYSANNREGVTGNDAPAYENASSKSGHTVIDLTGVDNSPATGNANAQATTYSYTSHTADNEMGYQNAGFTDNTTNSGYAAAFAPTPTSGDSPTASGVLPLPQNMANSFNSPATGNTTGRNVASQARNDANVYHGGINDSWPGHGNTIPALDGTQHSLAASGGHNWPGFGGNGSNGFNLPNLNQSPGSDNDVGYNRADYVDRDAPVPNSSTFDGNGAHHAASNPGPGLASQAPTDIIDPVPSPARAGPGNQQPRAPAYSPQIYDQNFSSQEAPAASGVVEPYFPAYPFEAQPSEEQPDSELTAQQEANVPQQDKQHHAVVQEHLGRRLCEDHQRQRILDQHLRLQPCHTEFQENPPIFAARCLPGTNQVTEIPEQRPHAPAPALEQQQFVLDQEIVFPNVDDAAAAIASVVDLLDDVPIEGPVWDWFDNQPWSSPEDGNPVYGQGWSMIGPPEPLVLPVQQEALETSPPQGQQPIPEVPYLAEPTIEEVINQIPFDWKLPAVGTDFNAADFHPDHPFADGLAGGLGQAPNQIDDYPEDFTSSMPSPLTQLIYAARLETEAEAATNAAPVAAPESRAEIDSNTAP